MWETSHPLSFAVAGYAIAASIMPNLVLIAAGHLVGSIPAASASGLGSAAGHRLVLALVVTGALYAAALVLGPVQSSLSSVVKWRLVYRTEDRLIAAVSGPAGIAHLEDPAVLDDLALAQGQLTGQMPADAPMTLALVVSNRVSGLFACLVLASWRWWLGLGMFVMWMAIRRPQLALIREQGALYAGGSEFEQVRFRYPLSAGQVFDGLDLVLRAGRSTALVGINGAGKTTLVKLLARLHDPDSGRILVDGVDLSLIRPAEWQRQVAVVFQDFAHYPLSLAENIGFGAPCFPVRCGRALLTRRGGRERWSCCLRCLLGTRCCRGRTTAGWSCPAGSGSGSRWPARCSRCGTAPRSWSWTSRPPGWTPGARPTSSTGSWRSPRAPPR